MFYPQLRYVNIKQVLRTSGQNELTEQFKVQSQCNISQPFTMFEDMQECADAYAFVSPQKLSNSLRKSNQRELIGSPNECTYITSPNMVMQLKPVTFQDIGEFYYCQRKSKCFEESILSFKWAKLYHK